MVARSYPPARCLPLLVALASSHRCPGPAPAPSLEQATYRDDHSGRPVLALTASRTQNLATQVLAALFEDLLELPVELADVGAQRGRPPDERIAFDVDVESSALAEQAGQLDPDLADFGAIGYTLQGGLYVWPPSLITHGGQGPSYDWYQGHADLKNASGPFPPLPIPLSSGGGAELCGLGRNASKPASACAELARFVPPHCVGLEASCAEAYAASRQQLGGHLEAMIVEHRLPYIAVYVGREQHKALRQFGQPFVSYGVLPGDDPGVYSPSMRILFPGAGCPHDCGASVTFPRKVASRRFSERWPAAALVLHRFRLGPEEVAELLELDGRAARPEGGAACAFLLARLHEFRSMLGSCRWGSQEVHAATGTCACPPGRLPLANGSCGDCPAHSFCPGLGALPASQPCGYPNATAVAANGSLGPASRADCVCSPGFEPSGGDCAPCPVGFYKEDASNTACSMACPASSASAEGSSSELDCRCTAGHFLARASPLVCTACLALDNGEGASCICDDQNSSTRCQLPLARPGWYMRCQGSPWHGAGLQVGLRRCPIASACLGGSCSEGSRCAQGSEGLLCGQCSPGFSRYIVGAQCHKCDSYGLNLLLLVVTFAFSVLCVVYCSARATGSTAHGNAVPAIVLIAWHHCSVVMSKGDAQWWLPQPIWAGGRLALTCALQACGVRAAHHQAAALALLPLVWPLLTLLLCLGPGLASQRCRRTAIARVQNRLDEAGEVLAVCEGAVEDGQVGHMKRDIRRHVDYLVSRSSFLGIWSRVRLPRDRPGLPSALRRFAIDSVDLIFCMECLLCPALLPVLLAALVPFWLPQPWGGWVLAAEPGVQFWSASHLPSFVICAAALLVYGAGLPVACCWAIRVDMRERTQYGRRRLCRTLRHGVSSEAPCCYWQAGLMLQRSLTGLVQEGYLPHREASILYLAIAALALLAHARLEPFSRTHGGALNSLQRRSLCCWLALALVYSTGSPDSASAMSPWILAVLMLQVYFWSCVAWEIFCEARRVVHANVTRAHALFLLTGRHEEGTNWLWKACAAELQGSRGHTGDTRLGRGMVQLCTWLANTEAARQKRQPRLTITNRSRDRKNRSGWSAVVKEIVIFADGGGQEAKRGRCAAIFASARSSLLSQLPQPLAVGRWLLGAEKARQSPSSRASEGCGGSAGAASAVSRGARLSFASVLERALRALLLIHHLDTFPTCIVEFLLCDAIFLKFEGRRAERRRRNELVACLSRRWRESGADGVAAAIEDDETRPQFAPRFRAAQVWHIAQQFAGKRGTGHSLTVDDLEYYVEHLQRESSALVLDTVAEFATKVAKATAQMLAASRTSDVTVQTLFFEDEAVQTDGKASTGTTTDLFMTQVAWGLGGRADELERWHEEFRGLREEEADLQAEAAALEEELASSKLDEELLRSKLGLPIHTQI